MGSAGEDDGPETGPELALPAALSSTLRLRGFAALWKWSRALHQRIGLRLHLPSIDLPVAVFVPPTEVVFMARQDASLLDKATSPFGPHAFVARPRIALLDEATSLFGPRAFVAYEGLGSFESRVESGHEPMKPDETRIDSAHDASGSGEPRFDFAEPIVEPSDEGMRRGTSRVEFAGKGISPPGEHPPHALPGAMPTGPRTRSVHRAEALTRHMSGSAIHRTREAARRVSPRDGDAVPDEGCFRQARRGLTTAVLVPVA